MHRVPTCHLNCPSRLRAPLALMLRLNRCCNIRKTVKVSTKACVSPGSPSSYSKRGQEAGTSGCPPSLTPALPPVLNAQPPPMRIEVTGHKTQGMKAPSFYGATYEATTTLGMLCVLR